MNVTEKCDFNFPLSLNDYHTKKPETKKATIKKNIALISLLSFGTIFIILASIIFARKKKEKKTDDTLIYMATSQGGE